LVADQVELDELVKAGGEAQELLEQLARVQKAGKKKKIKHLVSKILNSPAAKLSALVRTIYYDHGASPYTLTELRKRARALFPYARIDEPVKLHFKVKDSGELRPVLSFGRQRRALQTLCADILHVLLPAYSFDFMEKGNGGADGAAEHLGSIIKEGNYDFVLTADIRNCFRSVNKAGIAQLLPLLAPVTNNVLLVPDDTTIRKEPQGRRGTSTRPPPSIRPQSRYSGPPGNTAGFFGLQPHHVARSPRTAAQRVTLRKACRSVRRRHRNTHEE